MPKVMSNEKGDTAREIFNNSAWEMESKVREGKVVIIERMVGKKRNIPVRLEITLKQLLHFRRNGELSGGRMIIMKEYQTANKRALENFEKLFPRC